MRRLGFGGYVGKFFSLREFQNGVAAGLIALFVGPIEFMLEFVKPITLAMRLFGNIYGGELALASSPRSRSPIMPVALIGLETFVEFVQALIFSVLTLMFTMLAIEGHTRSTTQAHDLVEDIARRGPMGRRSTASPPTASRPEGINQRIDRAGPTTRAPGGRR